MVDIPSLGELVTSTMRKRTFSSIPSCGTGHLADDSPSREVLKIYSRVTDPGWGTHVMHYFSAACGEIPNDHRAWLFFCLWEKVCGSSSPGFTDASCLRMEQVSMITLAWGTESGDRLAYLPAAPAPEPRLSYNHTGTNIRGGDIIRWSGKRVAFREALWGQPSQDGGTSKAESIRKRQRRSWQRGWTCDSFGDHGENDVSREKPPGLPVANAVSLCLCERRKCPGDIYWCRQW